MYFARVLRGYDLGGADWSAWPPHVAIAGVYDLGWAKERAYPAAPLFQLWFNLLLDYGAGGEPLPEPMDPARIWDEPPRILPTLRRYGLRHLGTFIWQAPPLPEDVERDIDELNEVQAIGCAIVNAYTTFNHGWDFDASMERAIWRMRARYAQRGWGFPDQVDYAPKPRSLLQRAAPQLDRCGQALYIAAMYVLCFGSYSGLLFVAALACFVLSWLS